MPLSIVSENDPEQSSQASGRNENVTVDAKPISPLKERNKMVNKSSGSSQPVADDDVIDESVSFSQPATDKEVAKDSVSSSQPAADDAQRKPFRTNLARKRKSRKIIVPQGAITGEFPVTVQEKCNVNAACPSTKKTRDEKCHIVLPSLVDELLSERSVLLKENQILSLKVATLVAEKRKFVSRKKVESELAALKKVNSDLVEEIHVLKLREAKIVEGYQKEMKKENLDLIMLKQQRVKNEIEIEFLIKKLHSENKVYSVENKCTQTEEM